MKLQRAVRLLVAACCALNALPAQPGRRELVGVVRDPAGRPLEGAAVEIPGFTARTDAKGAFRFFTGPVDSLTISFKRPGYAPIEALISTTRSQWDTVAVEMEQLSQRLPGVTVSEARNRRAYEGLRTFDERKAIGNGMFITREDIVARNSLRLSDVLQARKGIQLVRVGTGRVGVRFANYASGSRGRACIPDLWLDGQRVQGMEIDDVGATNVEKMELYDSFAAVPSQFAHSTNSIPCGTIVIWTRIPGKP